MVMAQFEILDMILNLLDGSSRAEQLFMRSEGSPMHRAVAGRSLRPPVNARAVGMTQHKHWTSN
jgi:hypothetical protein